MYLFISLFYSLAQLYDSCIPSTPMDFGRDDGVLVIQGKSVRFPAKFSHGEAESKMMPINLSWVSNVHEMQNTGVD